MSLFQGDYLRVLTPQTTDGSTLQYDHNGQIVFGEQHLPLSARKELDRANMLRPTHLKHRIEVVSSFQGNIPEPQRTQTSGKLKQR